MTPWATKNGSTILPASSQFSTLLDAPSLLFRQPGRMNLSETATNNPFVVTQSTITKNNHIMIQYRGKKNKAARMANHLKKLDEMAHQNAHEEAVEKRSKKKAKEAARKGKKGGSSAEATVNVDMGEDEMDHEDEDFEMDEDDPLPDPEKVQQKMDQIVQKFESSIKKIRGAEPTADMFDDVQVTAYGEATSIKSVAQVVITAPNMATATCFDPSLAKEVAKAIQVSMGLNPSVDGNELKIPLPRVSMETREQLAKMLAKRTERFRQNVRSVRRKAMDIAKQGVAGKLEHVSKDDAYRVQQELESCSDEAIRKVDQLAEEKHKTIMNV